MFGVIGSLGSAIVSGISDYFKGKQEIKIRIIIRQVNQRVEHILKVIPGLILMVVIKFMYLMDRYGKIQQIPEQFLVPVNQRYIIKILSQLVGYISREICGLI